MTPAVITSCVGYLDGHREDVKFSDEPNVQDN